MKRKKQRKKCLSGHMQEWAHAAGVGRSGRRMQIENKEKNEKEARQEWA
jgi:hypothetical protein